MAEFKRTSKDLREKFTVENNTLSRDAKTDPHDRIGIEVGDSKQPDFKPQVKIKRWDNEVNFSIRGEEDPTATVETEGEVVKYKGQDNEIHLYEKPDAGEDGGFEFEWLLPQKPKSNVLRTTINSKGLNFHYQPELTQEEIDEGASRPENAIGSYAVYHATKGGSQRTDGQHYRTGKFCHIYRPKVTDADGNEVWGDLHISGSQLTVTVPQSFLDTAVYPVIVDPTFGHTSLGGSSVRIARKSSDDSINIDRWGGDASVAEDGTLDSIEVGLALDSDDFTSQTIDITAFLNRKDSEGTDSHGEVASIEILNKSVNDTTSFHSFSASSEPFSSGTFVLSATANPDDFDSASTSTDLDISLDSSQGFDQQNRFNKDFGTSYANAKEDPYNVSPALYAFTSIYAVYTSTASDDPPTVTTSAVNNIADTSADGNGEITDTGGVDADERGFVYDTTSRTDPGDTSPASSAYTSVENETGTFGTGTFSLSLTGLSSGTTYFVRAYAHNTEGYSYGSEVSFTTLELPTVTTQAASNVTAKTATGNGNITDTGGENATERGIVYDTTSRSDPGNTSPVSSNYSSVENSTGSFGTGAFTESLTGLSPNTTYYARAYAENSVGFSYGGEVSFTTADFIYSREATGTLPTNDDDLATVYTDSEKTDVDTDDGMRVGVTGGADDYVLHQFVKYFSDTSKHAKGDFDGQTDVAPSTSTVKLQAYNRTSGAWVDIDTDSSSSADTDFTLEGETTGTASEYYDSDGGVKFRVYQQEA